MALRYVWDSMSTVERAQVLGYGTYVGAKYIYNTARAKWNNLPQLTRLGVQGAYRAYAAAKGIVFKKNN